MVNLAVRKEWERRLQAMRSRYPYLSLASRLKDARDEILVPQVALHGEGRKTLVAWNFRAARIGREDEVERHRGYSLQMLHSDRAYDFMTGEGFGDSRMPSLIQKMRPEFVEFADVRAPLPEAPATLSGEHGTGRPTAIPLRIAESYTDRNRMPALNVLNAYHRNSQLDFVPGGSMGYVESVDRVVGFEPHGFRRMPAWPDEQTLIRAEFFESGGDRDHPTPLPNHPAPRGKWKILRLELVSLLLHDEPCVYEAETLPRMENLKKHATRKLNAFETKSLAALRDGEELKAEAELNEIRMVGAIRAAQQCKSCHNVSEGALLGAFSYDLQRDPPLKLKDVAGETY